MQRPRLKAHYLSAPVGSDQLFLLAEDRSFLLQDEAAVKVAPYLDGRHHIAEIAQSLAAELTLSQILLAIERFRLSGHLADDHPGLDDGALAYWDALDVDPAYVHQRVAGVHVKLVAIGDTPIKSVATVLRTFGLQVSEADREVPESALTVVVVDDYLRAELAEINQEHLATGQPWLLGKATGFMLWAGPLLVPGRTGCWSCMAQRLDGNRQVERYVAAEGQVPVPLPTSRAMLASTLTLISSILAGEIAQILATGTSPKLEGTLVTLDMRRLQTAHHALIWQPQCPSCGNPDLVRKRDPRITLRPNRTCWTGGSLRTVSPTETYQRLERHIGPHLGAVSYLAQLSEDDNGISFSYAAGHNFAVPPGNLSMLRRNLGGQSGGKGRTNLQAKVSGVCEALERYSGVWRDDQPTVTESYDRLGPDEAVHPETLLLYSDQQYANRDSWNANGAGRLHIVPERFHTDWPIAWSTAWSLTDERPRKVPAAYCWFGHPDLNHHFFCYADANGNAAGNTIEEAILQGWCEVVERDSVALWWYNRAHRPALDMNSVGDPYVDAVREYYASVGRDMWVLDITTDLGVPAYAAVSRRVHSPVEDIIVGFGAHPVPKIAAIRAITELNQFLPAVCERHPDGSTRYGMDDPQTLTWWRTATAERETWLLPTSPYPTARLQDHKVPEDADLSDVIGTCVQRARAANLEVIVLDQSRPDIDLRVVKVISPGLRHFWRRLSPGRLYETPVQLGWLRSSTLESKMNPTSVFI